MTQVCVSQNFSIDGNGDLGVEPWAVTQLVDARWTSNGINGAHHMPPFGGWQSLPGYKIFDYQLVVTNTAPIDRTYVVRFTRPGFYAWIGSPNVIQMRDKWLLDTGPNPMPYTQDTSNVFNGMSTVGQDVGTNRNNAPNVGAVRGDKPGAGAEDTILVKAGNKLAVSWTGYVWTPPPWSTKTYGGQNKRDFYVMDHGLFVLAMPAHDGGIQ